MTSKHDQIAFTVTWEAQEGQADVAADIIARFAPEARKEPGLVLLSVNRGQSNPSHFLFYEIFQDAAAFEAHQQTPHFRSMIIEQALPILAKRERLRYVPL